jgi:DNA repair protein RecO
MHLKKDVAIVLRSIAYEERHRVITALTLEHGLISALAKNSIQSRRFGGALEIFSASDWIFTSKPGAELHHLSEARIREAFDHLRKDFTLLSLASTLNEIMLRVAPQDQTCADLFRLHSNALASLNDIAQSPSSDRDVSEIEFLNAYLAKLLQWNGSQPKLQSCLQCNTSLDHIHPEAELSCIIPSAGWICPHCRKQSSQSVRENLDGSHFNQAFLRVSQASIRDLQFSLCFPIRQVFHPSEWQAEMQTQLRTQIGIKNHASIEEHQELFKFLEALFAFHVPGFDKKPLKSLRFLGLKSNLQHPEENQL